VDNVRIDPKRSSCKSNRSLREKDVLVRISLPEMKDKVTSIVVDRGRQTTKEWTSKFLEITTGRLIAFYR
jgi:hypothetical protein